MSFIKIKNNKKYKVIVFYDDFAVLMNQKTNQYFIMLKGQFLRKAELVKTVPHEEQITLEIGDLLKRCNDFYDVSGENLIDGTYMFFKFV